MNVLWKKKHSSRKSKKNPAALDAASACVRSGKCVLTAIHALRSLATYADIF
jgi:hypothetical protein